MQLESTLGGKADAGSTEKTEEDKEIEGARKLLEGTGFEDQLFPEKNNDNNKKEVQQVQTS